MIAVQGPSAESVLDQNFRPINGRLFSQTSPRKIVYGVWKPTGEDLVVLRQANYSFEIHCHGGTSAPTAITKSLTESNVPEQSASDFLRSQTDAWTVDVQTALSQAPTERTSTIILNQLEILPIEINEIVQLIRDDKIEPATRRIQSLLDWSEFSKHLIQPRSIVLCGQPNVGKSSLVNAMVGFQRAIVHSVAGTTRDVVSQQTAIDGWPVELKDTAGLRESNNDIETIGIEKARSQIETADLKIAVFDFSSPWTNQDQKLLEAIDPDVIVHNKSDLAGDVGQRPAGLQTSVETGMGIDRLISEIGSRVVSRIPPVDKAILVSQEQVDCFARGDCDDRSQLKLGDGDGVDW